MKLIKTCPIMLGMVAAMALSGASSALATSTHLCKVHKDPCPPGSSVTSLHMENVGEPPRLLNTFIDILCLNVLFTAEPLALANPQLIHVKEFSFSNCGTNAVHSNCAIVALELPLASLLKTGLNLGVVKYPVGPGEGSINVKCTIFGFVKINCDYQGAGLEIAVEGANHRPGAGRGMLTSVKTSLPLTKALEGGGMCPEFSSVDTLLESLENTYIVG